MRTRKFIIRRPIRRSPVVERANIGAFLRSIDAYQGDPITYLALKLMAYAVPQPSQLRTLEWPHINLHSTTPEWRIPPQRTKTSEPHTIPLSRQATQLLRQLNHLTGHGPWAFPHPRNPHLPIPDICIPAALRAIGYGRTKMTPHGFRTIASLELHELGFDDRLIATQLAQPAPTPSDPTTTTRATSLNDAP